MVLLFCLCLKGSQSDGRRDLFEDVLSHLDEILSLFVGCMKGHLSLMRLKHPYVWYLYVCLLIRLYKPYENVFPVICSFAKVQTEGDLNAS